MSWTIAIIEFRSVMVLLLLQPELSTYRIMIGQLELSHHLVCEHFPMLAEQDVVKGAIWQPRRVSVEPLAVIVRQHIQTGIEQDLERLVVLVAFYVPLAGRKSVFAAAWRHSVEVTKKKDRNIAELAYFVCYAAGLICAILWTVRMQVSVADVDYLILEDKRRDGEPARSEKENLSGKWIIDSMTVEHLELTKK